MNILIVDDEISAIEAVSKGINWDKMSVEAIYTATSMKEAIEQLEQFKIDIMLCDIEMPMGNGIQLFRWIRENKPKVECIYMTCHADFMYVQQALQLGSIDYLLKPLNYEEVEAAIDKAANKLQRDKLLAKNSEAWLENKEIVLKQFWKDLFVGEIILEKESLQRYISSKDIDIDVEKQFIPILVTIKKIPDEFNKKEERLMEYSIKNMAEELFIIEDIDREIIGFGENSILIIFSLDQGLYNTNYTEQIKVCCQKLIGVIKQYFKIKICCYCGNKCGIFEVPNMIENLQVIDFNNVVLYEYVFLLQNYKQNRIDYNNLNFTVWSELMQNNKFHTIFSEIKQLLTEEENLKKINRDFLKKFLQDYYHILIIFSLKHNIFLSQLFGDEKSQKIFGMADYSLDNLLRWIEYTLDTIKQYVDRNEKSLNPIDKTKKFIEKHISEEISMESIAKNVHLNADYLTRIFKKVEGVSISKFIINRKIDIAKKLLIETDKSIGDIALEVGYYNYSSFNRIFSKTVEMSPQEFKALFKV